MTPLVQFNNISKRFGELMANDHVSLSIEEAEIHGVIGGNGAGKSTLMKILYGLYQPDGGNIIVRGKRVQIPHPQAAIEMGMGMVQQDFLLIENMNAVENIILGAEIHTRGIINYAKAGKNIQKMAEKFHLECDFELPVSELSVGSRPCIELLKILFRNASIIILDEPTGPLVPHEVDALFTILRALKESGVTIIFISHKMQEVMKICDTVSVMRDGRLVATRNKNTVTIDELIYAMTGGEIPSLQKKEAAKEYKSTLELDGVTVYKNKRRVLSQISFAVHSGQIVGIAGVEGNGQLELEETLMGIQKIASGLVKLRGAVIDRLTPKTLLGKGIGFIPSLRHVYGMIREFSVAENIMLGIHGSKRYSHLGIIKHEAMIEKAKWALNEFRVFPPDPLFEAGRLSGGNQQKLVILRALSGNPICLIASHPTRGISIFDTHFIWQKFLEMKAAGAAILLITADLTELFTLTDEIAVMGKGRIVARMKTQDITPEQLGALMVGAGKTHGKG